MLLFFDGSSGDLARVIFVGEALCQNLLDDGEA